MRTFALALLAVLVAGCSRSGECGPGETCLRYMAWGNPEQLQLEQGLVEEFNSKNPGIHVKFVKVPANSYQQKLTMMLVSRTAPDVVRVDHYFFPAFQARGYFQDLTGLAQADPGFRRSDFYPNTLQEGTVGGKLFGLNVLYGGVVLYYNKNLFKSAGLEDPYELCQQGRWTWERFRADAKALTKFEGKEPQVFGTSIPAFPMTAPAIWGFGGSIMNEAQTQSTVDNPKTIRAYQFLADLVWLDHVAPTPAQGSNSAFTFESGRLGMSFDWMGMTPRFRATITKFDWDVCPVPAGPAGGSTVVKGNQLVITANSRHPEAAWRFARFLTGPEVENKLYAQIRRCFPTRRAIAESKEYLESTLPPFHARAFISSIEGGKQLPITERWNEWQTIFNNEIDNLMSGRERDAGVVLRRTKVKIDRALAEPEGF